MSFDEFKEKKRLIQDRLVKELSKKEKSIDWDIYSLIPDPNGGHDAISITYRSFYKNSNIPLSLPLFSLFSYISSYLVKNEVKIKIKDVGKIDPALWIINLADSGSSKTLSKSLIERTIPENARPETLDEVAGGAAFIQELSKKPKALFFQDEAAQMMKQLENYGSPLSDLKSYLLKAYDHATLTRATKKETVTVKNPVITVFWINTIQSFLDSISNESLTDGFCRRFLYSLSYRDIERVKEDHPTYGIELIEKTIKPSFDKLFNTKLHEVYEVSEMAIDTYKEAFRFISETHFDCDINEAFYRTCMWSSWIYSLIYHVVMGKTDNVIDETDMSWGLKAAVYHLYSVENMKKYKTDKMGYQEEKVKTEKVISKINELRIRAKNENVEFNVRYIQRKIKGLNSEKIQFYLNLIYGNKTSIKNDDVKQVDRTLNKEDDWKIFVD